MGWRRSGPTIQNMFPQRDHQKRHHSRISHSVLGRYRVLLTAIGVLAAAALSTDSHGEPSGESAVADQQSPQQQPTSASSSVVVGRGNAPYHQPNCNAPKSQDEADYCVQVHVAQATQSQVDISGNQMWFSGFEALVLLLTVYFSYRATKQAAASAKDSEHGVRLAAQSAASSSKMAEAMTQLVDVFHAASRAHISIIVNAYDLQERLIVEQLHDVANGRGNRITARFRYLNTGNTAAKISEISFTLTWGLESIQPVYSRGLLSSGEGIWNALADSESMKFPVNSGPMTPEQAQQILLGNQVVWFFARISYSDHMGKPHQTLHCRRLNINNEDFEIGPGEYNRTT